jgi:hypothetical protein
MHPQRASIALALLLILATGNAYAQWPQGPDSSLRVSAPSEHPGIISMVPDGLGGAIMCWRTAIHCPGWLAGYGDSVTFQRVSADGNQPWLNERSRRESTQPAMTPDGHGGFIVVWKADVYPSSYSDSYKYLGLRGQRFDASGIPQWPADVALSSWGEATHECLEGYPHLPRPRNPVLMPDGSGGAIAAWQDANSVIVQRITASGDTAWGRDGRVVDWRASSYRWMNAVSDQHGGVIVVFCRNDSVYAQRIDPSGTLLWGQQELPVAIGPGTPELHQPSVASDDSGGVIVAWGRQRTLNRVLLTQRVDAAGQLRWGDGGITVCSTQQARFGGLPPAIIADGVGGAVIAWSDHRSATNPDYLGMQIYAQRVARSGTTLWPDDGVLLSGAPDTVSDCAIASDGHGGAIVAWTRWLRHRNANQIWGLRIDSEGMLQNQIWVQRVDSQGTPRWGESGHLLATTASRRRFPQLVSDGAGGAIVAWEATQSIEAQRVSSTGELVSSVTADSPGSIVAMPNPTRQDASFRLALHRSGPATISIHDLSGRRVRALFEGDLEAGERWIPWDGRDDAGNRARPGVYFARVTHPGTRAIGRVVLLP